MFLDKRELSKLYNENKVIDFIAAVFSGFAVSYRSPWGPSFSSWSDLKSPAIYIVAYILAAVLVFGWKTQIRVKFGWIFIALIGSLLCAVSNEVMLKLAGQDEFFRGVSFFPIVIVRYFIISIVVMAFSHYLGLLVSGILRSHKSRHTS